MDHFFLHFAMDINLDEEKGTRLANIQRRFSVSVDHKAVILGSVRFCTGFLSIGRKTVVIIIRNQEAYCLEH